MSNKYEHINGYVRLEGTGDRLVQDYITDIVIRIIDKLEENTDNQDNDIDED